MKPVIMKKNLHATRIALFVLAAFASAPAGAQTNCFPPPPGVIAWWPEAGSEGKSTPPELTIFRTGTNALTIAWPAPSSGLLLEQNSNPYQRGVVRHHQRGQRRDGPESSRHLTTGRH